MTWRLPSWSVLLLAGLTLTTGCIGQAADLGRDVVTGTTAVQEIPAGSQPSPTAGPDRQAPSTVSLALVVSLEEANGRTIPVEDVFLAGPPEYVSLELRPLTVAEGTSRTIATLTLPTGHRLPAIEATLLIDDGLGLATIPIEIGPWRAQRDARVGIHLSTPEPGSVAVQSVRGEPPAKALVPTAEPTYGLLLWPNGIKRVLHAFEGTIHVPQGYPDLPQDRPVSFRLTDAGGRPVSWRLDGEPLTTGPSVDLVPKAGQHVLTVELGKVGPSFSLSFSVDDRRTFTGAVEAGTGPLRRDIEDLNGDKHPVPVSPGASHLSAVLSLREPDSETTDLDLYLLDQDGNVVDQSAREGASTERVQLPAIDLVASEYRLWVYAAEGADVDYELSSNVFYR